MNIMSKSLAVTCCLLVVCLSLGEALLSPKPFASVRPHTLSRNSVASSFESEDEYPTEDTSDLETPTSKSESNDPSLKEKINARNFRNQVNDTGGYSPNTDREFRRPDYRRNPAAFGEMRQVYSSSADIPRQDWFPSRTAAQESGSRLYEAPPGSATYFDEDEGMTPPRSTPRRVYSADPRKKNPASSSNMRSDDTEEREQQDYGQQEEPTSASEGIASYGDGSKSTENFMKQVDDLGGSSPNIDRESSRPNYRRNPAAFGEMRQVHSSSADIPRQDWFPSRTAAQESGSRLYEPPAGSATYFDEDEGMTPPRSAPRRVYSADPRKTPGRKRADSEDSQAYEEEAGIEPEAFVPRGDGSKSTENFMKQVEDVGYSPNTDREARRPAYRRNPAAFGELQQVYSSSAEPARRDWFPSRPTTSSQSFDSQRSGPRMYQPPPGSATYFDIDEGMTPAQAPPRRVYSADPEKKRPTPSRDPQSSYAARQGRPAYQPQPGSATYFDIDEGMTAPPPPPRRVYSVQPDGDPRRGIPSHTSSPAVNSFSSPSRGPSLGSPHRSRDQFDDNYKVIGSDSVQEEEDIEEEDIEEED